VSEAARGRVGSVIKGKWKVDARIGSGGMATVYAATHRNGHRAALKMLHSQLSRDASVRARFLREAYVANAVVHPAVVRIEDDDVSEDGCVFLVMELLEGETLEARRIRNGGAMPLGEVMEIGEQALDALAAAHEKGIVHRDVKPENVFVTNGGRVKLLDFGLARMKDVQGEATRTGVTIGTPEFMPPEQALGRRENVDARSDVWGLGATMFTAITGEYVHTAQNLHEQLMASATRRARSLKSVSQVPLAVSQVIDRALELDMADRWPTARDMQRALRQARVAPTSDASLESLPVPAASSTDPISFPIPISSDKTVMVSGGDVPTSSDQPTIQRAVPGGEDRTVALDPASAASIRGPTTARLGQTGGNPPVQLQTQALKPTTPRLANAPPRDPLAQTGGGPPVHPSAMVPARDPLAQTGGGPPVRAYGSDPAMRGMPPRSDEAPLERTVSLNHMQSGALRAGVPQNPNPALAQSGSSSIVVPPRPARARGAIVATVFVLLGLVALILAILVRAGVIFH
jgi:serine/threonine-protein kinase